MKEEAAQVLPVPREDAWALIAEPFHLPDWWPGYTGVEPDRRGLAENARWEVVRGARPGLMRKPHGSGLILIRRVSPGSELSWHDLGQKLDMGVRLEDEGRETKATAWVAGPIWRLYAEGARLLPAKAVARLHDLCDTASGL
ncbi:MAG TPA: SRPBCC family protein [Gaiellaceae bacterium]|nr:SRPBCC family protein [Gaiellaceae bacterium]